MNRQEELRNERVGILLLKYSIPAIVGMLVNALYNIIDRMFVGKGVGELALAGLGVTFPFMTIIMAFSMLVGIGGVALTSIKLGEDKREEAEHILGNSFVLMLIITAILTILSFIFMEPLLYSFGASEDTIHFATDYTRIIIFGLFGNTIGFSMSHAIRAQGYPIISMISMLIGAITNIVLDAVFIYIFDMGIKGVAYATIIAQALSAIFVLAFIQSKKSTLRIHLRYMKLSKKVVLGIFSIGMSPFAMQLAASVVTTISNRSLKNYGDDLAISAMSIISSVAMIFFMPIFGINQGSQPIIGYNYGAKQYDRVKKALKLAVTAATTISVLGFIVVQLFPEFLISFFNDSPRLMDITNYGMRINLITFPIIGFQIVTSNYFQAIGKAKISMFLSLSRQVIFLIPALLLLPPIFKLNGVWMAAPVADAIATITTGLLIWREMRMLDRKYQLLFEN